GVGAGRKEKDDLARRRRAGIDELAYAPRDDSSLAEPPVHACVCIAMLVGYQHLHGMAEDRIGKLRGGGSRLEPVAEVRAEELVHRSEHLGARAVVQRQRQQLRRARTALAEDADVGVAEAVDRLKLVPDEEDIRAGAPEQIDEVALQAVRVLELVDHDRAEAQPLAL